MSPEDSITEVLLGLGEHIPGPALSQRWNQLRSREVPIAAIIGSKQIPESLQEALPPHVVITPESGEQFADCDLLVCPMAALRMFPTDTAEGIEIAGRERIPVWILVSGVEMLSNPQEFLETRLPSHRARLPEGSETFVIAKPMGDRELDRMHTIWENRSQSLFLAGRARRLKSFMNLCRGEIAIARSSAASFLDELERSLETGQHGVSALKIEGRLAAELLSEVSQSLRCVIESWLSSVENEVVTRSQGADPGKLRKNLEAEIEKLVSSQLKPAIREGIARARNSIELWRKNSADELERYFRPFWAKSQITADLGSLTTPTDESKDETNRFFGTLESKLCESGSALQHFLQGSWLAEVLKYLRMPVTKKGKLPAALGIETARREAEKAELLSRISESARSATAEINKILVNSKESLAEMIQDELELRAVLCVKEASVAMSAREAKLRLLQNSERKLVACDAS